jgi:predicted DNA-binding transcriptional regulator YafY
MNKLYIALALLKMLSERNEINSRYVADELNISIRTAQRYLIELLALPFVLHNPERNTYSLVEKYNINGSFLKSAEMSFLNSFFGYAKAVLGESGTQLIDKITNKIFHVNSHSLTHLLINSSAIDYEQIAEIHIEIERLINEKRVFSFLYARNGKSYIVEPYSIIFHNGFWYLAAGHDGVLKKFVMEFIEDIKPMGSFSEIPEKFIELLKNSQSIWFEQGETAEVTLKADSIAAGYIKRKPLAASQQILEEHVDGSLTITLRAANEMELFHLICYWINAVEVIEPSEYREFIKNIGSKILQSHS